MKYIVVYMLAGKEKTKEITADNESDVEKIFWETWPKRKSNIAPPLIIKMQKAN